MSLIHQKEFEQYRAEFEERVYLEFFKSQVKFGHRSFAISTNVPKEEFCKRKYIYNDDVLQNPNDDYLAMYEREELNPMWYGYCLAKKS